MISPSDSPSASKTTPSNSPAPSVLPEPLAITPPNVAAAAAPPPALLHEGVNRNARTSPLGFVPQPVIKPLLLMSTARVNVQLPLIRLFRSRKPFVASQTKAWKSPAVTFDMPTTTLLSFMPNAQLVSPPVRTPRSDMLPSQ